VAAAIFSELFFPPSWVFAAEGTVVFNRSGCRDYFVVETNMGYTILEWFGGHDPSEGARIVGDYNHYGMKDVYDVTAQQPIRVWVEDYDLSKDRTNEKMAEYCN
jgi:hypothetical protein